MVTPNKTPYLNSTTWRYLLLRFALLLPGMIWTITATAQGNDLPQEIIRYADIIFTNGQVLTADADEEFTIAEAVAVRDNRILAVGSDERINLYAGPETRRIDLRGRSMTPGFIYTNSDNAVPAGDILKDTQWGGYTRPQVGGETIDQALRTIAEIVGMEGEAGEPLFFNLQDQWAGVASQAWDISMLDEIAPDVPIIIYLDTSHTFANTAMIELALEEGFPEDHLSIGKDEYGNFNGKTGAHFGGFVGRELRPWPAPEWFDEVVVDTRRISREWARHGVTGSNGHMSSITMTVLNRLFHSGKGNGLSIRYHAGLDFPMQNPEGEKFFKRLGNLTDFALADERGPMVTVIGVGLGPLSGAPDGSSSLLTIEPKQNVIPELSPNTHGWSKWTGQWYNGLSFEDLTPQQRAQTDYHNWMLARQHGYSVSGFHNMGSKAINLAMQFVKEANEQENLYVKELWRPYGTIHNIDWLPENYEKWEAHPEIHDSFHFSVTLRAGIEQRDAVPIGLENVLELMYGREGLSRMAPLRTLYEKGIPFHIEGSYPGRRGMDWPTWNMYKAVTRIDHEGRVIAAEEAIDRKAAFLALTRWPARYIGALGELGSIEPGKLADLVVFNGNIMDIPIENLPALLPVMTLVGGWVAYEAPESELNSDGISQSEVNDFKNNICELRKQFPRHRQETCVW